MAVSLSTPVTGLAQTGLTSPTYTLTADQPPDVNAKQWAVTALGGTQTGVVTHTASSPFTVAFWKPRILKILGKPNPTTGLISNVPKNAHKVITRKGVTPAAGQPPQLLIVTTTMDCPAGAETYDAANVRAALSLHFGSLSQQSAGVGDSVVQGIL